MRIMDFEKMYSTYYMQVYSYMMTLAKNRDLAEELTQNTFYKAMTSKAKFCNKANELTWLCSIANSDTAYIIHLILHDLEEPYKEVFQLRVFGELSFQQIASIFRKSENWARVTYHRARLKIQERMDHHE